MAILLTIPKIKDLTPQLAFYNKADVYGLLFSAASQTLATIAGDPKHLGADVGASGLFLILATDLRGQVR